MARLRARVLYLNLFILRFSDSNCFEIITKSINAPQRRLVNKVNSIPDSHNCRRFILIVFHIVATK